MCRLTAPEPLTASLCSFLFVASTSLTTCSCCYKSSEGWLRPSYSWASSGGVHHCSWFPFWALRTPRYPYAHPLLHLPHPLPVLPVHILFSGSGSEPRLGK